MRFSKEEFDLVVEAIYQEYKNNPIKITHPQSLLSAAQSVAFTSRQKEESARIYFDPTQNANLKTITPENIRSIIYSLSAIEKILKNCSPGKTVRSERPMTIPAFIPDDPLRFSLTIYNSFNKWYSDYKLMESIKFEDMDYTNILYIYDLALIINQKIQLTAAPRIIFDLGHKPKLAELDDIEKHPDLEERRKETLDYLHHRRIIEYYLTEYQNYGGDMNQGNKVNVVVLTKNWVSFFQEIKAVYEKVSRQGAPTKSPPPPEEKSQTSGFKTPANTKWEDITIKFRDGHNVNIIISGKSTPADYKMMGFEDKKRRLPNQQWNFLQILAKNRGAITWQDSEANDTLKKKKQLLSDALKAFFGLHDDPFLSYKKEKAYNIRITLIPD